MFQSLLHKVLVMTTSEKNRLVTVMMSPRLIAERCATSRRRPLEQCSMSLISRACRCLFSRHESLWTRCKDKSDVAPLQSCWERHHGRKVGFGGVITIDAVIGLRERASQPRGKTPGMKQRGAESVPLSGLRARWKKLSLVRTLIPGRDVHTLHRKTAYPLTMLKKVSSCCKEFYVT